MIVFGVSILYAEKKYERIKVSKLQWTLLLGGSAIIIISFLYDYIATVRLQNCDASFLPTSQGLLNELRSYVPAKFNWTLFFSGFLTSCFGTFLFLKDHKPAFIIKSKNKTI
jgi:hypothetical protein